MKKPVALSPEAQGRAVLYLRFSSENQREESIEGQRRECLEYAKRSGIEVVGEYVDRAKSATTDDRPDFQRMIRASSSQGFGIVLVWKLDRFAHNRYDSLKYKAILKQNGVRVLSATERIMDGPDGIIMESLLDGMSEYYSADLSQKVKRGMVENVIKGKTTGGLRRFGYRIADGRYVIDENEGHMVKELFDFYAYDGLSIRAIWERFNALGYERTEGKRIQLSTLCKALASERYIGVLECDGRRNESAIPPLVDKATFYKAQERREKRKRVGGVYRADVEYGLTGRAYCGECGAMLVGESGTSKTGKLYSYYHCKDARFGRCDAKRIGKDVLENLVASLVLEALDDKKAIKEIASYVYRNQSKDSNELTKMRAQASKIQSQIDNFARAIGMGVITETTKSTLMKLEAERAEIGKRIQKESAVRRRYTKGEIVASLEILKNYLTEAGFKKKALLETFVEQVYVFKDGKVSVSVDIFGSKTKFQSCDVSKLKDLERIDAKSRETVECLYFHQRGFVAVGKLPEKGGKSK